MNSTRVLVMACLIGSTACAGTSPTGPTDDRASAFTRAVGVDTQMDASAGAGAKVRKVKSGTITANASGSGGEMTLSGARFEVSGSWSDGGSVGCQPCVSGVSSMWTAAGFSGSRASATIDGVRYDTVYLSGTLKLSGNAVVQPTGSPSFAVAYPFTVEDASVLIGYAENPTIGPARELFRLEIHGGGTATMDLTTVPSLAGGELYTSAGIVYTF